MLAKNSYNTQLHEVCSYLNCKHNTRGHSIYKSDSYKPNGFVLWCVSGSKVPLACVWHEERFYAAGSVPQNGASYTSNTSFSWLLDQNNIITYATRMHNTCKIISCSQLHTQLGASKQQNNKPVAYSSLAKQSNTVATRQL